MLETKEKTAPNTSVGADKGQSSNNTTHSISENVEKVKWLSDEKKIDEAAFCKCFCSEQELRYINGRFYTVDGVLEADDVKAQIDKMLKENGVTSGVAKKTNALFDTLKMECYSAPIKPEIDRIHILNGIIKVDGDICTPPTFIPEKQFCINRLDVEYDPAVWERGAYPPRFRTFLSELLEPEDILTLQEYMGYCLIPSTKGQAALFVIGNGGEGKSRLGIVLKSIFGSAMQQDYFQRIENDKFSRYNLMDKLVMYDDDMDMAALKSTGIVKNIITAEIPIDVEAKGKQSHQARIYCRFFCVGNGSPKALYDKSDGFARRLLILSTKPKPPDRVDDPDISDVFRKEKLQIFCWALDGLRRLIKNNYRFTVSEKTKQNIADSMSENNNIIEFLQEAVEFRTGAAVGSARLYAHYVKWCADNAMTALKCDTFVGWIKSVAEQRGITYSNNVYEVNEKGEKSRVRGFEGIHSDYVIPRYIN